MKRILLAAIAVLSFNAMAHTQSPGHIIDDWVYKEVNSYEFTLVNRNEYVASYSILVGNYNPKTGLMENEKKLGTIENLEYNEGVKFNVDIRVPPATKRQALMCTELVNENVSYRSRVCSLLELTRK